MTERPMLGTRRLILRPFTLDDAPVVQLLAGDRAIALHTAHIPHPYEDGIAEEWIGTHKEKFEKGELVNFAIACRHDKALIGSISLVINRHYDCAELGYWIGKPYWGKGYCSEAANEVLRYGFEALNLNRIFASHMSRNPASGRVMEKIGMIYEGCLRQAMKKWGEYVDMKYYGILKTEFKVLPDQKKPTR